MVIESFYTKGSYGVIFHDDGRVAYAYMTFDREIISDVWLYNRCETPVIPEWKTTKKMPFANATEFIIDNFTNFPDNEDDIAVFWQHENNIECACIYIKGELHAKLVQNQKPGYCICAKKDGPLAKVMKVDVIEICQELVRSIPVNLQGNKYSKLNLKLLKDRFKDILFIPKTIEYIMCNFNLSGACFELEEDDDLSETGVEMQWLTVEDIIIESFEAYPGLVAVRQGYLPIGQCLTGSGDPYFINVFSGENPILVRIPHDSVDENTFDQDCVEIISGKLSSFFEKAKQYPT